MTQYILLIIKLLPKRLRDWLEDLFTQDLQLCCSVCSNHFYIPRDKVIEIRKLKNGIGSKCPECFRIKKNNYKNLRKKRDKLHDVFDRIWRDGVTGWNRDVAYNWLSAIFKKPFGSVHFSELNEHDMDFVMEKIKERWPELVY